MGIYKLCHTYSDDMASVYIESDKSDTKIADIAVGLQFFIEDNTKHGEHSCITEEMAQYFLCTFFGCRPVEKEEIRGCREYDADLDDICEVYHIDMYCERERRCGVDYAKYEKPVEERKNTEFVRKLCALFDDDEVFARSAIRIPSVSRMLEKY